MTSEDDMKIAILNRIRLDPKIVDLKVSCYMAACNHISKDFPLVPNPKDYVRSESFDEILEEINESIPNIQLMQYYLEKRSNCLLSLDVISVLYWLIVKLHEPHLLIENISDNPYFDFSIEDKVNKVTGEFMRKPDLSIKFNYRPMSIVNARWKSKSLNNKTCHGYTPVRLQDLHSAIHRGPKGLEDKGSLGYGLTLCSELECAIERADPTWVWGKSSLASQMYAILVIEFVDVDKAVLKLARHHPVFFLILDTDYARIRYLFLWVTSPPAKLPLLRKCVDIDTSFNQRIIFGTFFIFTYLFMTKRMFSIPRSIENVLSLVKIKFFQHNK